MKKSPGDPAPRRRRRWRWLVGLAVAMPTIAVVALGLVFQFGLPWWSGANDRNHVYVSSDGTRKHYQVHLPPQHDGSTELPIMMALHGCGMTGFGWNSMKEATQFNVLADQEGFIVVYPTQRPFESDVNCWNSADPRNQVRGSGEPALLAGVVREVVSTYDADADRVHVSGASSGAGAAVILGATYPDVFATVTSVAGGEYGLNQVDPDDPDSTPASATARQAWAQMGDRARPLPLLVVQGGRDEVVPTIVGERLVDHWIAVHDLIDDGMLNESLALVTVTVEHPPAGRQYGYEHTTVSTPEGRVLVEYVFADLLAHSWSHPNSRGLFTDTAGPDVTRIAWAFAQRHDAEEVDGR
ncbi:hypothetical protein GCM10011490_00450 [Pseudoclavibacter endophyticus]|uniref:PHB depolymerase family esterase n=1 Tax=Pseudoclavibacter endophyticus TaxID=1778590 RepID=A0A6H9WU44_9MICO|nr:PHB depolymerase family esterase [Pseudoclavibacter endophyticus]KAB1650387.1 PHB depolymerase family esterase [Pseudoclavibacter endophyticus]GGA54587.1 hypothetical protein GCM10011490_00450 [Pseudoclavibacter endophyticus]